MKYVRSLGCIGCVVLWAASVSTAVGEPGFVSRAASAPRKVVVASALARFDGPVEQRLALAAQLFDEAAQRARTTDGGRDLDLLVLPEFAILRETGKDAAERAVELEGPVIDILGAKAREHRAWLVAPMTLREVDNRISNAAVLLNRDGHVAGIFRKVHPVVEADGRFEGGVTPGKTYPVFECDFGRLGILICWDMSYHDAWAALADAGAEIVVLPSASPQTLRPAAAALRHHFFVMTSTQRDNASLFDPIGRTIAQTTGTPRVMVHQIDLAYAILHWTETLRGGLALTERFGERVGGDYSNREDTGVFWSNDPELSIGTMVRELGLPEMPFDIERMEAARKAAQ
jgi:predicted amidohydrolase